MFWTRFRSSVILMIITIAAVVLGNDVLFAAALVISMIGMMELMRIFNVHKSIIGILAYLVGIAYYGLIRFDKEEYLLMVIIIFLLLLMSIYVISFPKFQTEQVVMAFFSVFYVAIMLSFIYRTRMLEGGAYLVWLIFISSWGSDTCAYLVGSKIGKHKMTPRLSPKKSIEGLFGGIIGAALIGLIYALIFGFLFPRKQEYFNIFIFYHLKLFLVDRIKITKNNIRSYIIIIKIFTAPISP